MNHEMTLSETLTFMSATLKFAAPFFILLSIGAVVLLVVAILICGIMENK